ncbi:MAG: hypothetical protein NTY15_06425 [Planctomycetota bacterium]|nr:hypothetical protein [Planctomycetota bacterium]
MRKNLWQAISLSLLFLFGANANAQSSISVPSDSKFVLQIDLQALKASKVGSVLFEMAKKAAMDEVGKKVDAKDVSTDKIQEVLGMDPFEEIQGLVICASDYESPEKSLLGMVRLKKTTGNIEGLLLALPGYEKSEHRNYDIHTASPDEETKVFGAIHASTGGNKTLIIGANKSSVTGLLDSLDAKNLENKSLKSIELSSDRKVIAQMQIMELPTEKLGKGPEANIAAMLSSLVVSLSEEEQELELRAAMQAGTEKKAEQIRQSIQGLGAMVELFASMDDQDDDVKNVLQFIKKVKVVQEGTAVSVKVRVPSAEIVEMIKKEMNDN